MPIKRIIGSERDGPGIIAFDVRNRSDKNELYISDLPDETNTLIFRLQNIYKESVSLISTPNDEALEIIFPSGIFDNDTQLKVHQVQLSKWKINRNEKLLNTDNTKQNALTEAVETLRNWQFLNYEPTNEQRVEEGKKVDLANNLKDTLSDYFTKSLDIKKELKSLFENYLNQATTPANINSGIAAKISNFPELAKLYERIAELNQQIEENIKDLITFRAEFQQQSEQSKVLLQKVIKDAIESHLGKMSKTPIFLIDGEKIKAVETINNWFEQLKLDDNLIDMLSQHEQTDSNWIIKTKFENGEQHISISAADIKSLELKPYEYFVIEINDFYISKQATIANNIEIKYPNAKTIDNKDFKSKFSQTTSLDIINRSGKKLPLHVELAPSQKLINDADTLNIVKINLTNTGLIALKIPLKRLSIFMDLAQDFGHFPTAFVQKDEIRNVIVKAVKDGQEFNSKSLGSTDAQAKNVAVVWENDEIELAPNEQFQIELSKIQTKLPDGNAPFTIRVKGVEGFRDKDFDLTIIRRLPNLKIEKVPIKRFFKENSRDEYTYRGAANVDTITYQFVEAYTDVDIAFFKVERERDIMLKTTNFEKIKQGHIYMKYIKK